MSELIKTLRQEALQENAEYLDEDYRTQAADLIEHLQQRIEELERELEIHKRHTNLVGELTEYMVKRGIGTLGSTCTTEIVRLYEKMEQRNNDLATTVDRLRAERDSALNKFHVIADKYGEPDSYKCVVYDMEDAELKIKDRLVSLGWTPPTNLNAVKREVYADGYYDGFTDCRSYDFDSSAECEDMALHNADEKANQRYPDKE